MNTYYLWVKGETTHPESGRSLIVKGWWDGDELVEDPPTKEGLCRQPLTAIGGIVNVLAKDEIVVTEIRLTKDDPLTKETN
jgi:hypothetical protein